MTLQEFQEEAMKIAEMKKHYQLKIYECEREIAINNAEIEKLKFEETKLRNRFAAESPEEAA